MKNKKISSILALLLASGAMILGGCSKGQGGGGGGDTPAVTPTVTSVTVTPSTLSLDLYGTKVANLSAMVVGTNSPAQTVTWSVVNSAVASVSETGVVTGLSVGSTVVKATSTVDTTKFGSCTVTVVDTKPDPIPEVTRAAAKADVRAAFNKLDVDDYTKTRWNSLIDTLNNSLTSIDLATTVAEINQIVAEAKVAFESAVKKADVLKGTWFDYVSSDAKYEFDRDNEGKLYCTYDGNPGHWVHCGTKQNLHTDTTINNVINVTLRNDISETIDVCFQIVATNGDKIGDTGITKIAGNETKTLTLPYDIEINKLYLFIDSCDDSHNRKGHVTFMDWNLTYEKREPSVIPDPKTVEINQAMTKEDGGVNTKYQLVEADKGAYIERVSAIVEVNFNGNGNSGRYYGLYLKGASNQIVVKDSSGYAQTMKVEGTDVGERILFNLPITSKMYTGSEISMSIQYAAGPSESHPELNELSFKVVSYTFHYGLWRNVETETVNVNEVIYDGAAVPTLSIPYSSFTKKGRVSKMTMNFTTINTAGYGKSQIYIQNFPFTTFSSGNNNVLNIGDLMEKSSTEPKSGSIDIYPQQKIDLTKDSDIKIDCWWASASMIRLDSITMYTDNMSKPESVTSLEAHSIESGVVLTWSAPEYATAYDVYMDDVKQFEVSTTYATIEGLVNGVDHTFKVVAKNSSGEAEPVSVIGHGEAGAQYDTFIEGLNTNLERTLGANKVSQVLAGSNYYESSSDYSLNNYRLQNAINKMKNGEKTTVAYMGGSITVGEGAEMEDENNHKKGYAYYSYQWLKRTYDKQNKSEFVNGSISGTGSEIGLVRAQKDIIDHNPDIVFVEFAANNGSTNFDNSSYESLFRKFLELPQKPAVILLFSYTYYSNFESGTEYKMAQMGKQYGVPMFSIARGMSKVVSVADKARTDPIYAMYSSDGTHPSDDGHQMYGKALAYFLRTLINRAQDPEQSVPTTPSESGFDRWENIVAVDNTNSTGIVTDLGSFYATNTATPCTSKQSDVTAFQQGWKKTDTSSNNAMTIKVHAKNFVLIVEAGNPSVEGDPTGNIVVNYSNDVDPTDAGELSWDVTKTAKQNTDGDPTVTGSGNGWQNPCGIYIFDKDVAGDYTITIKMDSNAGICTIFAFGYCA